MWRCTPCAKSFNSKNSLDQHERSATHDKYVSKKSIISIVSKSTEAEPGRARADTIHCSVCNRDFASADALEQHLGGTAHRRVLERQRYEEEGARRRVKNQEAMMEACLLRYSSWLIRASPDERALRCCLCDVELHFDTAHGGFMSSCKNHTKSTRHRVARDEHRAKMRRDAVLPASQTSAVPQTTAASSQILRTPQTLQRPSELHRGIVNGCSPLHRYLFEKIGVMKLEIGGADLIKTITPTTAIIATNDGVTLMHSICDGAGYCSAHDPALVVKLLELLVSCGADPSARDNNDMTPFMMYLSKVGELRFSTKRSDPISEFFLKDAHSAAISPNHRSVDGRRWLNLAIFALDLATFNYLIDARADVNACDGALETRSGGSEWKRRKWESVFDAEMEADGDPPLVVAARRYSSSSPFVEALLLKGANPNNINLWSGRTALHTAAKKGNEDLVKLLLKHGANISAPDHLGRTPLFSAGHYFVAFLASVGADINHKDIIGATAWHRWIHYCGQNGSPGSYRTLLKSIGPQQPHWHLCDAKGIGLLHLLGKDWEQSRSTDHMLQCDTSAFIL